MAKGFGKGSVGGSGFATGAATPGGTQEIGLNPPPSIEAEAQTAITGPVEDRLEARARRLLEPGVPAPPVATEAIQTDPDAAIRANVEEGMTKTKVMLRDKVWWPKINQQVENVIRV